MSMRGNNVHFSRATVHHELIPGHHLQGFMTERYNPQREAFETPFWIEGWALYWEMLLWDLGFPRRPEDRIGMLFWRMHRAARIIFSLSFHLGRWTPAAVHRLPGGPRRPRARPTPTAEVRRSFNGDYPPLYQVAYMIGGLQFRALHHELVDAGKMTDRAVPRRDPAERPDPGRAGAGAARAPRAAAGLPAELAVRGRRRALAELLARTGRAAAPRCRPASWPRPFGEIQERRMLWSIFGMLPIWCG